jgi:ankyrin repeat protein
MISRSNSSNPVIAAASLRKAGTLEAALQNDSTEKTKNEALLNEALLAAAEHGRIDSIKLLQTYGANLTYQSEEDGATAIAFAVQTGNIKLFKQLKESGARLDVRCRDGSTLLMLAAEHGHTALVKKLLKQGLEPTEQDAEGNTALMRAARKGNIEVMTALSEHSPNSIFVVNHAKETPLTITSGTMTAKKMLGAALITAIKTNKAHTCQILLESGADANLDPMNTGRPPLMVAAESGNKKIAKILLTHNATPNFSDSAGWTPLLMAASYAHADVMQLLLDQGADINTRNEGDDTALMVIISYFTNDTLEKTKYSSKKKSVGILLERGIDVTLKNTLHQTALTIAAAEGDAKTVSMLLNHRGASRVAWVDIKDAYTFAKRTKNTPTIRAFEDHFKIGEALIMATRHKEIDNVKKILDQGAAPDTPDFNSLTALHTAAENNSVDIAKLLISKKADVNSIDERGETPLMRAATRSNLKTIQYLIEQGAKPNGFHSRSGRTALMTAARDRNETIVKFLIDQGASVNEKPDYFGFSAVMLAAMNKNRASVSLLFKAGAIIDDVPAATERLEKKSTNDITAVNILFEGLTDNIKENIHQLFSAALTTEQFSGLLADTNKKTTYLVDQKQFRKLIRNEIISCIEETKKSLSAQNNKNALSEIQGNMQMLANQLTIIQKTESDTSEKTAKKKLLNLIADISEKIGAAPAKPEETVINDESKALFGILSNLQSGKTEKIIAENLLKTPDDETREALRLFLSRLNSRARDQIKQTLFQAIKALADEPKMEEETNSNLTINKIKKAFDEQQRPVLFEILRAHESGAVDRDTGTWKKLERLMQQGAFLRVGLPKVSLTSPFKRLVKGATTDQEMNPLLQKPTQ